MKQNAYAVAIVYQKQVGNLMTTNLRVVEVDALSKDEAIGWAVSNTPSEVADMTILIVHAITLSKS